VNSLQSRASDLAASPSATGVSSVTSAVANVAAAGGRLLAAIGNRCRSASPSPAASS
jgi:hypothetical protein